MDESDIDDVIKDVVASAQEVGFRNLSGVDRQL